MRGANDCRVTQGHLLDLAHPEKQSIGNVEEDPKAKGRPRNDLRTAKQINEVESKKNAACNNDRNRADHQMYDEARRGIAPTARQLEKSRKQPGHIAPEIGDHRE